MPCRRVFLVIFLLLPRFSDAAYSLNDNCRKAYALIWSYHQAEANELLARERSANPSNQLPYYLYDLSDFIHIFATDDKSDFAKYLSATDSRLKQLSQEDSPYALFSRGEIALHSGVLHLKFGDYYQAARSFSSAYSNIKGCIKKYPAFLPARRDLLLMQAMVGTVPNNYRWLLNILGFEGELKPAMNEYAALLSKLDASNEFNVFSKDSRVFYGFMAYYLLNRPDEAMKNIRMSTNDHAVNPISAFVRAGICLRMRQNDSALTILHPHVQSTPVLPQLDYLMGLARLHQVEPQAAFYFARFLKNSKGSNFIKDSYLKMGWAFLLAGKTENYRNCMVLAQRMGTAIVEEDKNALYEAKLKTAPNLFMLRARLLFDGGYFRNAKDELLKVKPENFTANREKAEFYYRLGRIDESLMSTALAVKSYELVVQNFPAPDTYFAPASCLFMAQIYENQNNKALAKTYYEKCLSYKGYPYKDSFDQKAYSGLERLK